MLKNATIEQETTSHIGFLMGLIDEDVSAQTKANIKKHFRLLQDRLIFLSSGEVRNGNK